MASHALNYDPAPSVNPTGAPSGDLLQIRATPESFGGSIAQATEKLGGSIEKAGDTALQVITQQQGMINETLATDAETKYRSELGAIIGKHRSTEGMAAVSAVPQVQADIIALRQKYSETLPYEGAKHAFTTLSLRHEGNALQDAQTYAAGQLKQADLSSSNASSGVAISDAGSLTVAQDDRRFQDVLHDINFASQRMMQTQGWGDYMKASPDGTVTFEDSPKGQQAKQVYEQTNGVALAKAYENRFHVLADQNVLQAHQLYERDRDKIPGTAQVALDNYFTPKLRDARLRVGTNAIFADADRKYESSVNRYATVADAIHAQESGGKSTSVTSIDGAMGGWQIIPATFTKYARPGEKITSPTDNEMVGRRIVQDLSQKFGGDPARVAVGYFSGEGNVAPPGSPTPWKNDYADGNGKKVSQYVKDVVGRMSGLAPGGAPAFQSKADYYRDNYTNILEDTRKWAEQDQPDNPQYVDQMVSRVSQRMSAEIHQQELSYKADQNLVQQAFNGDLSKTKRPTSVDQMVAISPAVKAAWERLQINNPQAALAIETRIMSANAKQSDHDTKTYGTGFYDLFRKIHAGADDPERITDPTKLYEHVGENGDLTISGLEKLTSEIQSRRSPDGVAEAEMKTQFLKNARAQITGTDEGLHIRDPKGDELYLKFMAQALPAYDAGRRAGKSPAELLNPESPDYIGKSITGFRRPMDQWFSDTIHDPPTAAKTGFDIKSIATVQDAVRAYHAGNITKQQADDLAIEKGWARRKVPPPNAFPTLPMSQ